MEGVNVGAIERFTREHPDARKWLMTWTKMVAEASWRNIMDVRKHYPHADGVATKNGVMTVFNVRGNQYRLLTAIYYASQRIAVVAVVTHEEYDKDRWKK